MRRIRDWFTELGLFRKIGVWVVMLFVIIVALGGIATIFESDEARAEREANLAQQEEEREQKREEKQQAKEEKKQADEVKESQDKSESKEKEPSFREKVEQYVSSAVSEMGSNTNLKVVTTETNEDGRYVITLSDQTFLFVDKDAVTAANTAQTSEQDVKQSFELAVGAMSQDFSMGERNEILNKLPIHEQVTDVIKDDNGKTYTYKGSADSYLLQVEK